MRSAEVFVNGCFDVLHVGHVRLLRFAATYGRLTVGINSDKSVKRLKGEQRPIYHDYERREMLMALTCVSEVHIYEEDTPERLLSLFYQQGLGPKYVVKGLEYERKPIPEAKLIRDNGGSIVFFGMITTRSSTDTIRRMR